MNKGQSSIYIVILVLVVIFAVMFSGGGESLLSGDRASTVTDTPEPSQVADTTVTPTSTQPTVTPTETQPTPTSVPGWSVSLSSSSCKLTSENTPYLDSNLEIVGTSNGYVALEVTEGSITETITTLAFAPPSKNHKVYLHKAQGFSTNPWRVAVYEGGSQVNGQWQAGVEKASYTGDPTGC